MSTQLNDTRQNSGWKRSLMNEKGKFWVLGGLNERKGIWNNLVLSDINSMFQIMILTKITPLSHAQGWDRPPHL